MATTDDPEANPGANSDEISRESVRAELQNIVESRHFRASKRSQQFLEYVIEQKLQGNDDLIKERVIGVEVFGRDTNYVTGDDPVVRVQASDVRRRLDAYRMEQQSDAEVVIELPTGTYVPSFRKKLASGQVDSVAVSEGELSLESGSSPSNPESNEAGMASRGSSSSVSAQRSIWQFLWGSVLLIIGAAIGYIAHVPLQQPDPVRQFWGPLLSSSKAVVISLGKPAVYVPSRHLYDMYDEEHPGEFDLLYDRHNNFLPLDKRTPIVWGDMTPVQFSGPAVEGVRSALAIALFLGKAGKASSARFGDEGSFVNFVDSPAVIIGNVNNRWTSDIEKNLPFRFRQGKDREDIIEAGTNRVWGIEDSGEVVRDYGLITREPVGVTGNFLLKVAGIRGGGTEAASEFVTSPEMLQSAISRLPSGWEKKNVQILVMTQVIGRKASPSQVVAVHVW